MAAEAGFFEAFYGSALQHPWLLWLAAAAGTSAALARRGLSPSLRRYALALGVLSALDAWLTSSHVYGLGAKTPPWDSAVPLFFVIAGDLRYLLLAVAATPDGRLGPGLRTCGIALALALIVPIASWPASLVDSRVLFFVYELMFIALAETLLRRHPNLRRAPWLRALTRYVQLYYALWATSDAILLATGSDLGFALRVVPNVLYYGGLIAAIAWLAPAASASGTES